MMSDTVKVKKKRKIGVGTIILHIVLILGACIMVFPFLWTVFSAFKNVGEIFLYPPRLFPTEWEFSNFPRSLAAMPFDKAYFNSIYIAVVVTAVQLITASMAGYAFGKLKFPGHNVVFLLFLATMMIPAQVVMIPIFNTMKALGLLGTHWSIIIPAALFNAFGVFLLRQFIMGLPDDLEEAAIVDGAGTPRIFFQIILPLVRSALAAFGIFVFLGQWNNFLYPLIFLNQMDTYTVPLMLSYFKGQYATEYPLLMAGTVMAVIPVLIIYIIFQKQIIAGIAITGMKS
ncbi:MAG: carbohydrate ABC transporter permease [Massiliimalia sp.]|jgi:multiple sugar transport system permease protein